MAEQTFEQFVERLLLILKDRRKELGLTQSEVGERIGRPQSAVARLESGAIRDPHISMLFEFCQALNLNVSVGKLKADSIKGAIVSSRFKETTDLLDTLAVKLRDVDDSKNAAARSILKGMDHLL